MTPLQPIPTRPFALAITLGGLASIGLGVLAALAAGSADSAAPAAAAADQVAAAATASAAVPPMTLAAIAAVLALGVVIAFAPLIGPPLVTPDRWGLIVLMVSGARTLLAMGAMMAMIQILHLERKPVVYGVLTGTVVMMTVEALAAVALLNRRERLRASPSLTRSPA